LRVRDAYSNRYPAQRVSFDASGGEILGFAGLVGAGRSEIAQAIVGLDRNGSAEVWLDDRKLNFDTPRKAIDHGFYLVPEDRRVQGLITHMAVRENITLPSLQRYAPSGLIRRALENRVAEKQVTSLQVKTPGIEAQVRNLSGGNQQKVVLGKWLAMEPQVMILDEPTRGIDVGAKAEIYKLMRALAAQGAVILMISSDMEEILHVSDRIAVMHEGRITGLLDRKDCAEENIMQLAVGRQIPAARPAFADQS
jgi:ribose transport system ATP-binding protein